MSELEAPIAEGTLTDVLDPRAHNLLIGQDEAYAKIKSAFSSGRFPHAWLLVGGEGVGKATLAWHVAREIVELGGFDNAGVSPEMLTRYAQHNHANIYCLTRAPDDKKGFKSQIVIDQVRALSSKLQLATTDGGWRAVIIDPMEALNTAASNAILKLLEEPPARVAFFLVTHSPSQLLPTIKSRCQQLNFASLSVDDMKSIWPQVTELAPPSDASFALAEGSIRDAFMAGGKVAEAWEMMMHILQGAPRLDHSSFLAFARKINTGNRSETCTSAAKIFGLLAGRIIRASAGSATLDLPAQVLDVSKLGRWSEFSFETAKILDEVARLNLDPETAIYQRWIAIEEILK